MGGFALPQDILLLRYVLRRALLTGRNVDEVMSYGQYEKM